jgi:type IV secretory pathway TraG/TraD family ATPase VirD4
MSYSALQSDNVLGLLARGREAGVGVLLSTQELADLDRAGRGLREQILGNTALKIAHRQDVPESAERVARLAGTMRVWEQSYQRRSGPLGVRIGAGSPGTGTSTSARLVERYRVEPEQVSTMRTGEALVVIKSPQVSAHVTSIRRPPPAPDLSR